MNRKICESCKHFEVNIDNDTKWWCASVVQLITSRVIQGASYYCRDKLHPMSSQRKVPPEWCPYVTEQTILDSDDDVEVQDRAQIVFDGNSVLRRYKELRGS